MPSISVTALAVASVAATAIGTGVAIYGQQQAASAAKGQANYQAAVMRNNAILAQRAADDARARGAADAAKVGSATRQLIGRQRATLASNGVEVDSGSSLDITSETAGLGTQDELTTRVNAERQALNFEAQGANFTGQAGAFDASGANAISAGNIGSAGTALSGIGSVASKWYDFNRAGIGSGSGGSSYVDAGLGPVSDFGMRGRA